MQNKDAKQDEYAVEWLSKTVKKIKDKMQQLQSLDKTDKTDKTDIADIHSIVGAYNIIWLE